MRISLRRVAGAFVLSLALLAQAKATTLSYSVNFGTDTSGSFVPSPYTQLLEFPQFNADLGSLTSVQISLNNLTYIAELQVVGINPDTSSGTVTYTADLTQSIALIAPDGTTATGNYEDGPYSGSASVGAGAHFDIFPAGTTSTSGLGSVLIPLAGFASFEGTGQVGLAASASAPNVTGTVVVTGPNGFTADSGAVVAGFTAVSGQAELAYSYTPAPEPASLSLGSTGLIMLALALLIRERHGVR